jgi:hypothetical protein
MGTFLGQILGGNKTNLFRLKVCASLAAAFWSGGYLSFFATRQYAGTSLMFSAVLYAALGLSILSMGLKAIFLRPLTAYTVASLVATEFTLLVKSY